MDLRQLGKYEIVAKIGQGAMGEVFKAHDPILGRDVAIKTMTAAIGADEELRKRFRREAQSAARLSHPNIITIYDFGEDQGKVYMAMELLEGSDLKDLIGRHTPMSLDQKLGLMEQVCEGLAFAHANDVVHRDLKPANLHIHRGGQIKIMDFGLAKLSTSDMTRAGMIMGTPNYMSPEQVKGDKATARSDVFSLGAVFYELLSNRKPFEADSLHAVLFQVMQNEPEPLRNLVPDLPPALAAVVERAMQKDPAGRFRDAGEMREALRPVRSDLASRPDATIVQDPANATVMGVFEPMTQALPVSSLSESAAAQAALSQPATPLPATDGAVALERESRGPADTVAPQQPTTLSGRASTQVPSAAPATPIPAAPAQAKPPSPAPPARPSRPMPAVTPRPGVTEPMRLEPAASGGAAWKTPALAGGAVLVALVAVGLYVLTRPEAPAPTPSAPPATTQAAADPAIGRHVADAQKALAGRDYKTAVEQAGLALQKDPQNAAARAVVEQAQAAQKRVDAALAEVRRAVDAKDAAAASRALEELVRLEPAHPLVPQFREALSGTFRGRAEQAQAEMKRAQREATQAKATAQPEFKEAILAGRDAEALLARNEFVNAAPKFQQARDAFVRAQEAQRAAVPTPVVVAQATPVPPPTTIASAPPPPTTLARALPPTTAATVPPAASEEPAIRRLIADFDRAFETGDVTLWRSIRVGASDAELKSVAQKNWKQVNITIEAIDVLQSRAIVRISRRDLGTDGKTYPFAQTLTLQKDPSGWKITSLGR